MEQDIEGTFSRSEASVYKSWQMRKIIVSLILILSGVVVCAQTPYAWTFTVNQIPVHIANQCYRSSKTTM